MKKLYIILCLIIVIGCNENDINCKDNSNTIIDNNEQKILDSNYNQMISEFNIIDLISIKHRIVNESNSHFIQINGINNDPYCEYSIYFDFIYDINEFNCNSLIYISNNIQSYIESCDENFIIDIDYIKFSFNKEENLIFIYSIFYDENNNKYILNYNNY